MHLAQKWCILGLWYGYFSTLTENPVLEVKPTVRHQEVAKSAMKPSLQKH